MKSLYHTCKVFCSLRFAGLSESKHVKCWAWELSQPAVRWQPAPGWAGLVLLPAFFVMLHHPVRS